MADLPPLEPQRELSTTGLGKSGVEHLERTRETRPAINPCSYHSLALLHTRTTNAIVGWRNGPCGTRRQLCAPQEPRTPLQLVREAQEELPFPREGPEHEAAAKRLTDTIAQLPPEPEPEPEPEQPKRGKRGKR